MKRLLILSFFLAFSVCGMDSLADTGGDPPVVTIYDADFNDIESMTVMAGEAFVLYGVAIGDTPFCYYWYVGALIGTGWALDYTFGEPGDYMITLEVVDVNGLSGHDSVLVTVKGSTLSTQDETWGGIKALFR